MQKIWLFFFCLLFPVLTFGQAPEEASFSRGKIIKVLEKGEGEFFGEKKFLQEVHIKHLSGTEKGTISVLSPENTSVITENQKYKTGKTVVLQKTMNGLSIRENFRLPAIFFCFLVFLGGVLIIGKKQGALAFLGLFFSILILTHFLIPQILKGANPLSTSLVACLLITTVSIYLAHGIKKKTHLAILATFMVLIISFAFAFLTVHFVDLFGLGTEQAHFVFVGMNYEIDLQGLLLGGIMLGTIGILDDVTTTQCATVEELKKTNPSLSAKELYLRGSVVGKDHIASMLNTLALAYAGAGLPIFLLIALHNDTPWWVLLNSEFIAEEIIRTLIGSTALLLAVPISTALAANFFANKKSN